MSKIEKIRVSSGMNWIEISEAKVFLLCGCPADSVKHLIKNGLIKTVEKEGVTFETGPNAILLSDFPIQNGQFSNLAEFPVLQMLYRQGMQLPNHPNNNGQRPIILGNEVQVKAQLEYIYRGNYGLSTLEEIMEAGIPEEEAKEMFRMKLRFAFGKIMPSDEFLETKIIEHDKVEIKNGVYISRIEYNKFLIEYKGESVEVDLSLEPKEEYAPPYNLGFYQIKREYFAIIHSGEGDGWDIHRPCMSSILIYNGYIYLLDAGPNLLHTLNALGISVSAIRGIFHTHCHDDHFSGLTTLIQADHKIKYYATPLVRASVSKKLSALMSTDEDILDRYFEIKSLNFDEWNTVEGLEVRPLFSPHPVETSNFLFRVISEGGYRTYYHMADISGFDVMKGMINEDKSKPGITKEFYEKIKKNYLIPANIKKIDNGGGIIHGKASDFRDDTSEKIILSHNSLDLTYEEKEIGSRASFGLVDVLIPSNADQASRYAKRYLHAYFPDVAFEELRDILNCPVVSFNAGSILLKQGDKNDFLYLTLTGTVEMINSKKKVHQLLSAGSMVGEMAALLNEPRQKTYVALGYVWALKIPSNMYQNFVNKHNLKDSILKNRTYKGFLSSLWLFHEMASSPILNQLSLVLQKVSIKKGDVIPFYQRPTLAILMEGEFELKFNGKKFEGLIQGQFCREELLLENAIQNPIEIIATKDSIICELPGKLLSRIPAVLWKLFEIHEKRKEEIKNT